MKFVILILEAFVPFALSLLFIFLINRTKFKNLHYWVKQIIFGLAFGAVAIFATECGVSIEYGVINIRDSGPIIAGLFFGLPAGIIAGLIGGVERYITSFFISSRATFAIACSVATIIAGVISGIVRLSSKKSHRLTVLSACIISIIVEVFHFMLVYLTNMDNLDVVIKVYRNICYSMLFINLFAVLISGEGIKFLERHLKKEKMFVSLRETSLSNTIQIGTITIAIITFVVGFEAINNIQNKVFRDNTLTILSSTSTDTCYQAKSLSNYIAGDYSTELAYYYTNDDVTKDDFEASFLKIYYEYEVPECTEAYILRKNSRNKYEIDEDESHGSAIGEVTNHTYPYFIDLIGRLSTSAVNYISLDDFVDSYDTSASEPVLYSIYKNPTYLKNNSYLILGMSKSGLYHAVGRSVKFILNNQSYNTGATILFGSDNTYIGSSFSGTNPELEALAKEVKIGELNSLLKTTFNNEDYYATCVKSSNGFAAYSMVTSAEASLSSTVSLYFNSFLFMLCLSLVFVIANILIDRLCVQKMASVGDSLEHITKGNLETKINVRGSDEFNKLSDGINSTVDRLKEYIAEANMRIDRELQYAKQIQLSTLPDNNFSFNNVTIYAETNPAKFVGGDFYDFYTTKDNLIHFLIADVSGKGIPAALFMMRSKAFLRSMTTSGIAYPDNIVESNNNLSRDNPNNMFVTTWQGCLNYKTGELTYVNGGHEYPFISRGGKPFTRIIGKKVAPLGCFPNLKYVKETLQLKSGDKLFLYTDGCEDAINTKNERLTGDRLLELINKYRDLSPKELALSVKKEIYDYSKDCDQFDDITMLVLEYKK